MFDQGRGFERGERREFYHPFDDIFFNIHVIDILPHTDISHVGGLLACAFY